MRSWTKRMSEGKILKNPRFKISRSQPECFNTAPNLKSVKREMRGFW